MNKMKLLLSLAIPVLLSQDIQAQTSSRLTARANWRNDGAMFVPVDSTQYTYNSSSRGGDLKKTLKYDNALTWAHTGTEYRNSWNYIQEFDASNNITVSVAQEWDGSTGAWVNRTKSIHFYTGTQLTRSVHQNWASAGWVNASQNLYSYDASNRLLINQHQLWNTLTSAFDANSQQTYYYDGAGNVSNETAQNFVAGVPVYTHQYAYTYSGTNQNLTTTYSVWDGSAFVYNNVYTNTYDTIGNKITQLYQTYNTTTLAWDNARLSVYSDFTSGKMPQTEVVQNWNPAGTGTWDNWKRNTYAYNSSNQMTWSQGISWNLAGFWNNTLNDPMARYYYGTFSNVSVSNVTTANGDANIYPVPAQGLLHIDLKWDAAQTATIAIMDMTGKIVMQWDAPNGTSYHSAVSVDNLAAGNYVININGQTGKIVKQIVVAK